VCKASLARFKIPRRVVILDSLPKNPIGKIAKPVLRDLVAAVSTPGPPH
jgi:acyl-CoA synthetase (AMP-forming)/AMP-acid ligase II